MARLVTQSDINAYNADIVANGQRPMQLNDIIFFLSDRNGFGNIFNSTAWTGARNGATVWIEGGIEDYNCIDIGSSSALTAPSDVNNPNHIHFFNGRGNVFRADSSSLDAREFEISNFNYLVIDFETNSHPGLRDGWGSGRTGTFGLLAKQIFKEKNAMALRIENTLGTFKSFEVRGCELTMGSFAKLRASSNINTLDKVLIERCLFSHSQQGEGIYLGLTVHDNRPIHHNTIVRDNIFICTAAESIQLQQTADGSKVHNNVVIAADHDYRTAFQADQDTLLQVEMVSGGIDIYNNIFWHFGKNCIQIFGRDGSADGGGSGISFSGEPTKIRNNYFRGSKAGVSFRTSASLIQSGAKIIFRDNDIGATNLIYQDVGPMRDYHFDMDGPAPGVFINNKLPDDSQPVQNSTRTTDVTQFGITREAVPEPEFVNLGFGGIDAGRLTRWGEHYEIGDNHGTSANTITPSAIGATITFTTTTGNDWQIGDPIKVTSFDGTRHFYGVITAYNSSTGSMTLGTITDKTGSTSSAQWYVQKLIPYAVGDFVLLMENESTVPIEMYKCISAHSGHETYRPDLDATKWEKIWWDANGKSMYDAEYNGTPATTDFMEVAGDVRLVKGSYHHLKGRGLSCNEQRDDRTQYGWQWKQTEGGTVRDIPGAYDINLDISRYSYLWSGRQIRGWVRAMSEGGTLKDPVYTDWQTIP